MNERDNNDELAREIDVHLGSRSGEVLYRIAVYAALAGFILGILWKLSRNLAWSGLIQTIIVIAVSIATLVLCMAGIPLALATRRAKASVSKRE
jgi:NADH:ubiquinone oxidoreductase subunit 2 (subunit N)